MKEVVTLLLLSLMLVSPISSVAHSQTNQKRRTSRSEGQDTFSLNSSPPTITPEEQGKLSEMLKQALYIPIQILPTQGAPLTIFEAKVKGIKREKRDDSASAPINDYAMQASILLLNNTDREITAVGLRFTNSQAKTIFNFYPKPVEIRSKKQVEIDLMLVTGNPADLVIEVIGVGFADKGTWGAISPPPPLPPPPTPTIEVDSKPRPLNSAYPRYTELARAHQIQGDVRLSVLVDADGNIKRVEVLNALPDGLTEEAIKSARQMRFKPALKNGEPVEMWLTMEVGFNLK